MAKLGLRDHKYDEFSAATAMDLLKMEVEMSSTSPNKTISLLRKSPSIELKSTTFFSKKTRRALCVLSVTTCIIVFLSWYYITQHGRMSIRRAGHIRFDPVTQELHLTNLNDDRVLRAEVGMLLPGDAYPLVCEEMFVKDAICIDWLKSGEDDERLARMEITSEEEGALIIVEIKWDSAKLDSPLQDCILMGDDHWYGGSLSSPPVWPLDRTNIEMQPFISRGNDQSAESFGGILERFWLSSSGLSLVVQDDVPLYVGSNDNHSQRLCFRSEALSSPFQNPLNDYPALIYKVFISNNVTAAHRHATRTLFKPPTHTPNPKSFSTPIWHTAANLPNISSQSLLRFVQLLKYNGFHSGDIELEAPAYIANHLESEMFLSTDVLTSSVGFNWTVHLSPYFDVASDSFAVLASKMFLIRDVGGLAPTLVEWRGTYSGILDVTNSEARDWLYERWQRFRKVNSFTSLVFEGGYGMPMPPHFEFHQFPDRYNDPTVFCTFYTKVADRLGRSGRRKCGHRSQESPLFIQMDPWGPNWHGENGLRGIIPAVLLHGILGYPFVIPPPVCGPIDTGHDTNHPLLDEELYVRWVQLMTYLPVMSFCVMPWDVSPNATTYVQEMIRFHREEVSSMMKTWAQQAIINGKDEISPTNVVFQSITTPLVDPEEFFY